MRCQRQKKRADFREVPRLAAITVAGNRWHDGGPEIRPSTDKNKRRGTKSAAG